MAQKSIKRYFLKGKAHESGNCREDQIEINATAPKQIEQESASEAKQPRMDRDAQKIIMNPPRCHQNRPIRGKHE